jgi:hypothetical protein
MNPSILSWISDLLALVETYATVRAMPGTSTVDANVATVNAAAALVTHALAHPATPTAAPTSVSVPVTPTAP